MSIINTSSYAELYSLVQIEWDNTVNDIPVVARGYRILQEVPFPDGDGKLKRMSEYDFELYAHDKPEGGQAAIQKSQLGYENDMYLFRKALNVEYTYEGKHYDKYSFDTDAVREAKNSLRRRLDLDIQHRIGFGFATSYVNIDGNTVNIATGDGLALFSTAHTLKASTTTYRNILANNPQVSKGAAEAMEQMWVENTMNNFGQKIGRPADGIWSTDDPNTCNTIRELIKATAGVSAPNAGVPNVYQGKWEHLVLPLVATDANGSPDTTKAKYWGYIARGKGGFQGYLGVNEEPHIMPLMYSNSVDVRTDNSSIPCRVGYGITVVSARFISCSKGDTSA